MPSNVEKIRDRRAHGRIPVSIPAQLQDDEFEYVGTAVDLSPGGLRVKLPPGAALAPNSDYDVILKPPGEPVIKLKGRVMHVNGTQAGIALATGDAKIFEAAFTLYDNLVFKDPKLALRLKKRPTTMELTQRLWPLPLEGAALSGPEHWVYGTLRRTGSTVADSQAGRGPGVVAAVLRALHAGRAGAGVADRARAAHRGRSGQADRKAADRAIRGADRPDASGDAFAGAAQARVAVAQGPSPASPSLTDSGGLK
ncbi:MAG: PilZ domain-containing protein [Myxococcales bacterium]